jgi:ABC transport permease subunit
VLARALDGLTPPRWLWRTVAAITLGGQVAVRICTGRIHWRNTAAQLRLVGPASLGVALLTSGFVGMVFTIQFVREFAKLGLTRSVGGVLGLALARELTPVVTSIILAGRVGSAFAAELGTMAVSEQTDSLRVLGSDPTDYLVTPRVLACMVAGPILNALCFAMGMAASTLLAQAVYDVPANIILDSAARAVLPWDVITSCIKAWLFGGIIAVVSCAWGFTTTGGAKGVGEATTSAVVISLVAIFVADFGLSFLFFQGAGDALKQLSG